MMKYFSVILVSLLLIASCQSESVPKTGEPVAADLIKFSGDYSTTDTKTTLNGLVTNWISGSDKVGIYCPQAKPTPGGSVGVKNSEYTANSSAFYTGFAGTMYWGVGNHTFYAYYPYTAGTSEATSVPISLNATQTQNGSSNAHIGTHDFTVATPLTIEAGNVNAQTTVNLAYNHVFSFIEFKLVLNSGTTNIRKIEFSTNSANNLSLTSGRIDISQNKPDIDLPYTISSQTGTKMVTLNVNGDCIATNNVGTTTGALMVILPGNHVGSSFTATIYTDLGKVTVVRNGIDIKRNNKYTLTVTNPTFVQYDLILPTEEEWALSSVWDVMNGDTKVGEICKEYLRSYAPIGNLPNVDAQAVTYYTRMSATYPGYINMTSGKVASVLKNITTPGNGTSYTNVVGTSTINGGSVSFNVTNRRLTFTHSASAIAGVSRLPFSVFGDGQYASLTKQPRYLTDTRKYFLNGAVQNGPYNYKIVKVGTQYWIGENLRTTQDNDNVDIPEISDNTAWKNRSAGAYCKYNNDASVGNLNGPLYNGLAVGFFANGLWDYDKLAPEAWRVSDGGTGGSTDLYKLWSYLGSQENDAAGGKMKSTDHWTAPNTGATNISLLDCHPTGYRSGDFGTFASLGTVSYIWGGGGGIIYNELNNSNSLLVSSSGGVSALSGYTVRLVKITPW